MNGSAAPASRPDPAACHDRRARGDRHLWVPRGIGNAAVLLALVLDRDPGHPDNATATARMLEVDRESVRRWRRRLVADGLVVQVAGYLIATDAGRALLRQSDPLPRALLRGRGGRPTPETMRACAVVYADAVGWRADRRGCRTDAERAKFAGVSRPTVRLARELMAARDLIGVEAVRRGRADLRRARLTDDRRATHGAPMASARAERLAAAAVRGRSGLQGGAAQISRRGAAQISSPMQSPTETYPMQGPSPRPVDGSDVALLLDGCGTARRGRTVAAGDLVADVLRAAAPESERQAIDDRTAATSASATAAAHAAACAELRDLAGDRAAVQRLLAKPDRTGCAALLELLRVFDRAPRKRAGLAVQVAQMLGTADLLALAVDSLLGRPRNLAAVVLARIRRHAAGEAVRTRCRADWPLVRLLDAVAAADRQAPPAAGRRRAPEPRDHDPHRQIATAAAAEAAVRGDWCRVDDLLRRHALQGQAVADRAGIDLHELQQRLDDLADQRRAHFVAGLATSENSRSRNLPGRATA